MVPNLGSTQDHPRVQRSIIFIGETGTGKSSAINLLKTGPPAPTSNDSQPCTQGSTYYETTFNGTLYKLWDTRGLGEGRGFLRFLFGENSEKDLKRFLKERHMKKEIDLLVFCIRGSRATEASKGYYKKFCAITRRLAAPVAVVVTHLENEAEMEDWWKRNSTSLEALEMVFDDYVCITTVAGHARLAESKQKLVQMITKKRRWRAKDDGTYFGSPVRRSTSLPRKGGIWGRVFGATGEAIIGHQSPGRRWSNAPSTTDASFHTANYSPADSTVPSPVVEPSTPRSVATSIKVPHINTDLLGTSERATGEAIIGHQRPSRRWSNAPSTTDTSFHTPNYSPADSTVPSPVVEPPTPRSVATSIKVPHINTDLLGTSERPQLASGETPSTAYSALSMFNPGSSPSSHSSYTDDVYLETCTEEDSPGELSFRLSATVVKRKLLYPTRRGAFGDVWECELISEVSSRMVAVKAVKIGADDKGDQDVGTYHKKLRRELKVWVKLRHKNIVPLLGVVSGFGPLPSAVSPWFHNGSLLRHLSHYELPMSKKHRLLGDIAVGLCYLHGEGVIHGDLHSDNVLINEDGTACITDFGLSFMKDFVGTSYLKSSICGGVHFADPALFRQAYTSHENVFYPTKPCDIYSFGGLILHVLSGKKPYDGIPFATIIDTVMNGKRPKIPTGEDHITPWHRLLIRMCWDPEECKRPSADELVNRFDRQ